MAADTIRFYLDENVSSTIAEQLRRKGIEVFTVNDVAARGDTDSNHLQRATEMGCVLCTHDTDFLRLAQEGIEHTGIVFGRTTQHEIGDWVKGLELLHMAYTPEEMKNHVEYL